MPELNVTGPSGPRPGTLARNPLRSRVGTAALTHQSDVSPSDASAVLRVSEITRWLGDAAVAALAWGHRPMRGTVIGKDRGSPGAVGLFVDRLGRVAERFRRVFQGKSP